MAHLGGGDAFDGLQGLLDAGLAVAAHHAFDLQGTGHGFFLLQIGSGFVVAPGAVHVEEVQPERVGDDAETGEAHGRRAEHGVQLPAEELDEHARRQRDADHIVDERPEQVLVDVAQRGAAEADGGGNVRKPTLHQHHVRGVDGHVRARADGDARVCGGERRCVVDAVAHHGDPAPGLQAADGVGLALGQHARDHLVHAGLRADGPRRALVVAGEHHHADAHVLQLLHRPGAVLADHVRYGDEPDQAAVAAEEQRGLARLRQRVGSAPQLRRDLRLAADEGQVAAREGRAVQRGGQSAAGQGAEVLHLGKLHAQRLDVAQHGPSQGMFTPALQRSGHAQQRLRGNALRAQHVRDLRFAGGDGAGLVQGDDLRAPRVFQRDGGLEQHAVLRAHAVAHHDGHWRGQSQRAGAGDDQYGDGPGQGVAHGLACQHPDDEGDGGNADHRRNEHAGDLVRNLGDGGLGGRRVGDHFDDLAESGVLAHAGGLAADEARLVHRGGGDRISRRLVYGDALAGERGLVDGSFALQHHAVHGNALARAHHEHVAPLHLGDGNLLLRAAPHHGGRPGGQLHQRLQRVRGFALGARLQHLSHRDQCQDRARRLKIEFVHPAHHGGGVAPLMGCDHRKECVDAV